MFKNFKNINYNLLFKGNITAYKIMLFEIITTMYYVCYN